MNPLFLIQTLLSLALSVKSLGGPPPQRVAPTPVPQSAATSVITQQGAQIQCHQINPQIIVCNPGLYSFSK